MPRGRVWQLAGHGALWPPPWGGSGRVLLIDLLRLLRWPGIYAWYICGRVQYSIALSSCACAWLTLGWLAAGSVMLITKGRPRTSRPRAATSVQIKKRTSPSCKRPDPPSQPREGGTSASFLFNIARGCPPLPLSITRDFRVLPFSISRDCAPLETVSRPLLSGSVCGANSLRGVGWTRESTSSSAHAILAAAAPQWHSQMDRAHTQGNPGK